MIWVCTSEYMFQFVPMPQQYLYFDQYHLLTLKLLMLISFKPKEDNLLRQFDLFAHFSCNLIHTDMHIFLSVLSEFVWLWGPWCDKQANCHGNPASLALPEVAARTLPLSSQVWHFKAQANVPFPFQGIISPLWVASLGREISVTWKSFVFQIKTMQGGREELESFAVTTQVGKEEWNVLTSTHWKQRSQYIWGQSPENEQDCFASVIVLHHWQLTTTTPQWANKENWKSKSENTCGLRQRRLNR